MLPQISNSSMENSVRFVEENLQDNLEAVRMSKRYSSKPLVLLFDSTHKRLSENAACFLTIVCGCSLSS
jgi:hypothetical protein